LFLARKIAFIKMGSKNIFILLLYLSSLFAQIPWKNCGTSNDHVDINSIVVTPYPPQVGNNITVTAMGTSNEMIVSGSVNVELSFDMVVLLNQSFDLCSLISSFNIKCPIGKGPLAFKVDQNLPSDLPTGDYTAIVTGEDQANQELFCLSLSFTLNSKRRDQRVAKPRLRNH